MSRRFDKRNKRPLKLHISLSNEGETISASLSCYTGLIPSYVSSQDGGEDYQIFTVSKVYASNEIVAKLKAFKNDCCPTWGWSMIEIWATLDLFEEIESGDEATYCYSFELLDFRPYTENGDYTQNGYFGFDRFHDEYYDYKYFQAAEF